MKRFFYITLLFIITSLVNAQPFKFYYSNVPKFLKSNNDTMQYPFTGGMNAPQFSNIDFNNDGIKDLFVFDRSMYTSGHKHLTFLNLGNKFVYAPQYESVFPEMKDWAKLIDYNGDGKEDIYTQISQEKYQLIDTSQLIYSGIRIFTNKSDASGLKFSLINNQIMDTGGWWASVGQPKPSAPVSINRSDISGIEDLDGDGDIDIIGFNGFDYSPFYFDNWTINPQGIKYNRDTILYIYRDACWGYIQYDINSQTNRFNLGQSNLGACTYQLYPKMEMKHAASSVTLIDLNGDGIKDFIYGDGGFKNLVSLINGRKLNSLGRDSLMMQDTSFPSNTTPAKFINWPTAYYVDIDGDNTKELLVTTNDASTAKSLNNVWVYENDGTDSHPVFNYQGNNFALNEESIDLGTRSVPVLIDIDKDGDKDLIVATNGDYEKNQNYNDRLVLFENVSTDPTKSIFSLADTNFLLLSKDTSILNLHPTFGDVTGDGKEDLIIGDANGYLLYYINQSIGTNYAFELQSRKYSNIAVRGYAAPQLVDFNKDGKLDLIIGTKQGIVQYFENTGTVTEPQFASTPTIDSLGGIFVNRVEYLPKGYVNTSQTGYATPHVCDLDNDGKYEMLVGCESGYIYLYTDVSATPSAKFTRFDNLFVSDSSSQNTYRTNFGARTAPFSGYLDGDDKLDVLIGNMRGGLHLYASTKRILSTSGTSLTDATPQISLYPNPAYQFINMNTENLNEDVRFEVYSTIGQLMDSGNISKYHSTTTISTANYTAGIYFIVFKGESGYSSSKRFFIAK